MKHMFRISSHLTFYLSKKIIEVDGLNTEDCIAFLVRDYEIPSKYTSCFGSVISTSYNVNKKVGRIFSGINILKTYKNISYFDALIDEYVGDFSFVWYTQICNDDFFSLIITKKNCSGYYVIEDGLGSYLSSNPQTFTGYKSYVYKFLLRPLFPRIYKWKKHFINTESKKFLGCISTSEKCFPLHRKFLRVIGNPFEDCVLDFNPDAILSVDPLFMYVKIRDLDDIYRDLALYIKRKKYNVLGYKFHPYFDAFSNREIKKEYEKSIKRCFRDLDMVELPRDVVLENVIFSYKSDFYTDRSSVALYASEMGATCYSYASIIKKYCNEYKELSIINSFCSPVIL